MRLSGLASIVYSSPVRHTLDPNGECGSRNAFQTCVIVNMCVVHVDCLVSDVLVRQSKAHSPSSFPITPILKPTLSCI